MSSMLKKGAGAFKPKVPITRRRPAQATLPASVVVESAAANPLLETTTPDAGCQTTASPPAPSGLRSNDTPPPITEPSKAFDAETTRGFEQRVVVHPAFTEPAALASEEPAISTTSNAPRTLDDHIHRETPNQPAGTTASPSGEVLEELPAPVQDDLTEPAGTKQTLATTSKTDPLSQKGPSALKPAQFTHTPVSEPNAETEPVRRSTTCLPEPESTSPKATALTSSIPTGEGSSVAAADPSKLASQKPRKRKTDATVDGKRTETATEIDGQPRKKRTPRKDKAAARDAVSEAQEIRTVNGVSAAATPRRKASWKKRREKDIDKGITRENGEPDEGRDQGGQTLRTTRNRRMRSVTPEDAEIQKVDHERMVMGDLTRDLRIGTKFSRHDELRKKIRDKRARQRLIKLGKLLPDEAKPSEDNDGRAPDSPPSDRLSPAPAPKSAAPVPATDLSNKSNNKETVGPQFVIVDGQIQLDERTTQYDRHAAADQARGVIDEQEEDEFTTAVNNRTYMRRQNQPNFWTDDENLKFYHGLRMFGTDFNTIAKMFGGTKSRRQVKLKFNREERANPVAVNGCIIGVKSVPMDLDAVDGAAELEDSQAITDELDRLKALQEAETRRQEEERAAADKKKRDELFRGKRLGDHHARHHQAHDHGHGHDEPDKVSYDDNAFDCAATAPGPLADPTYSVVGTDPDVIDETDLFPPSQRPGRGRSRRSGPDSAGGIGA